MKKWITNDKQEFDGKSENVIWFSAEIRHEIYSICYKSVIFNRNLLESGKDHDPSTNNESGNYNLKLAQTMKQRDVIQ